MKCEIENVMLINNKGDTHVVRFNCVLSVVEVARVGEVDGYKNRDEKILDLNTEPVKEVIIHSVKEMFGNIYSGLDYLERRDIFFFKKGLKLARNTRKEVLEKTLEKTMEDARTGIK